LVRVGQAERIDQKFNGAPQMPKVRLFHAPAKQRPSVSSGLDCGLRNSLHIVSDPPGKLGVVRKISLEPGEQSTP
jgi:hypothetical protein